MDSVFAVIPQSPSNIKIITFPGTYLITVIKIYKSILKRRRGIERERVIGYEIFGIFNNVINFILDS